MTTAYHTTPEREQANARLIAAAPALLDACRVAASYYERLPQWVDRGHDVPAELAQLRAAIAAAEGE